MVLFVACATADATSVPRGHPIPPSIIVTPAPRPTPTPAQTYEPGPSSIGGAIRALRDAQLTLRTIDGDVDVDLSVVRQVWKETDVQPSALEVRDDLFVNGSWSNGVFVARYVWANIGRLDGVIRSVSGTTIELLRLAPRSEVVIVELSRYVTFVAPLTVSDLRPGLTIGAVVYRPKDGLRRLTRIWS